MNEVAAISFVMGILFGIYSFIFIIGLLGYVIRKRKEGV